MESDFPHPEVLEYLGLWRRRRQPKCSGPEELDEAWARSMREKAEHPNRNNRKPSTIFRVPEYIRQDEPKAYEPTVVSIGPLHRSSGSRSNSLAALEETKWQCFRLLLDRRDRGREIGGLFDACLAKMMALEEGARECYPEHSLDHMSPNQFAEILLLDGCFILYHLLKEFEDKRSASSLKEEDGARWCKGKHRTSCCAWIRKVVACCNERIPRDDVNGNMEELEKAVDDDDDRGNPGDVVGRHDPSVTEGDDGGNVAEDDDSGRPFPQKRNDDRARLEVLDKGSNGSVTIYLPKHNLRGSSLMKYDLLKIENQIPFYVIETLFDLLRTPKDEDLVDIALSFFENLHPKRARPHFKIKSDQVDHLLQLLHMAIVPQFLPCMGKSVDPSLTAMLLDWIPSASELQESGVRFRKGADEAGNFLNISFSGGVMEMGPIHIFSYSSSVFRNLMAYEERIAVPPYITIYASFMGRIVRTGEDARLLRSKGIVVDRRGSDEEAATFFDRLCKRIHYPERSDYLRDVFIEVRNHRESRPLDWKAILARTISATR